jgi:hypothetical protein
VEHASPENGVGNWKEKIDYTTWLVDLKGLVHPVAYHRSRIKIGM